MSDKQLTREAIVAEYTQVCKDVGEATYRIKIDQVRVDNGLKRLYELNMKASELENLEKAPAAETTEAQAAGTTQETATTTQH